MNLDVKTVDPELEGLEYFLSKIVYSVTDPDDEPTIMNILRPLVKNGACYQNWEAYKILSDASAKSWSRPNGELLEDIRLRFFSKCGLNTITKDVITSGIDAQAEAKAAKAEAIKIRTAALRKQEKRKRYLDNKFSQKDISRMEPDIDLLEFAPDA